MLNNIFFYLPMGYLLKTRLNSLAKFNSSICNRLLLNILQVISQKYGLNL